MIDLNLTFKAKIKMKIMRFSSVEINYLTRQKENSENYRLWKGVINLYPISDQRC